MRRALILLLLVVTLAGCGVKSSSPPPKAEGVIYLAGYVKPADFSHFEVFVGLAAGFTVTGWNGSAWVSQPNAPADWNGITNTLFTTMTDTHGFIGPLTPGLTYYVRVAAVDKSGNRSAPSIERAKIAEAEARATLIVAAADANPLTRAGADYVCDGIDDAIEINAAWDALPLGDIENATAQAGAATTITLAASASQYDGFYNGLTIEIRSGQGAGQYKKITAYNGSTHIATVDSAWTTIPNNTSVYAIVSKHGKVVLTDGVFVISDSNPINIPSNCTLEGQGAGATVVKFNDGIGASAYATVIGNADKANGNVNIQVCNLTIDGNRRKATNILLQRGIFLENVLQAQIRSVHVTDTCGMGIGLQNCRRTQITDCVIRGAFQYGGIRLAGANWVISDNQITGCHVSECREAGITLLAQSHNIISNNIIDMIDFAGIILDYGSNENIVSKNIVKNCSRATDNYYDGIRILESSRNRVEGNTVRRAASGNQQRYGIHIWPATDGGGYYNPAQSNLVTNNDCYTAGKTAGIKNEGMSTMPGAGNINNAGTWSTTFS